MSPHSKNLPASWAKGTIQRHVENLVHGDAKAHDAAVNLASLHLLPRSRRETLFPEMVEAFKPEMDFHKVFDTLKSSNPDGNARFLLDMRAALNKLDPSHWPHDMQNHIAKVRGALGHVVKQVFAPANLQLRVLDWNNTGKDVFANIMKQEAVHKFKDEEDLKQRVGGKGPGRMIYAMFCKPSKEDDGPSHFQRMQNAPCAFVQVALINKLATNVQELLNDPSPGVNAPPPTHAIFYSITSPYKSLEGTNMGPLLLKEAMADLKHRHPTLSTYVTLSPIPMFAKWALKQKLSPPLDFLSWPITPDVEEKYTEMLKDPSQKHLIEKSLKPHLIRYLLHTRRTDHTTNHSKGALDPVENFHLRNGAALHQINFCADNSHTGVHNGLGCMANYLYLPGDIQANAQRYAHGYINITENMSKIKVESKDTNLSGIWNTSMTVSKI